jgi:hypothetical protein
VACVALRSGGWADQDLKNAVAIFNDPEDLLSQLSTSPFFQGPTQDEKPGAKKSTG